MLDLARESVLHGFVAAAFVAALIGAWRVREPHTTCRLHVATLVATVALAPLFSLAWPQRRRAWFREDWALFDGSRWAVVKLGAIGVDGWALLACAVAGFVIWLRDAAPLAREALRGGGPSPRAPSTDGERRAESVLAGVAATAGAPALRLEILDTGMPVLRCVGVRRGTIQASNAALERFDPGELRAAFAHEAAHAAARDPLRGWTLMAVRTAFLFNPVVQVLARQIARDKERIADDIAARATGDAPAVASAVLKMARPRGAPGTRRTSLLEAYGRFADRSGVVEIEARCRRLLDGPGALPPLRRFRLALASAGLVSLLALVV